MATQSLPLHDVELRSLHDVLREHVIAVLTACHGNRTLAARALQIDRKTIYRMLQRWGSPACDASIATEQPPAPSH
jgi:transcriptional regulator of acetoin/glycerol metabolism